MAKSRSKAKQPEKKKPNEKLTKGNYVVAQEFHDPVNFDKVHRKGTSFDNSHPRFNELLDGGLISKEAKKEED